MAANGISTLTTKQAKQDAKLTAAATKRGTSNRRATLNKSQLPTQYTGDTVTDNDNTGGLVEGRPWTT